MIRKYKHFDKYWEVEGRVTGLFPQGIAAAPGRIEAEVQEGMGKEFIAVNSWESVMERNSRWDIPVEEMGEAAPTSLASLSAQHLDGPTNT